MKTLLLIVYLFSGKPAAEIAVVPTPEECLSAKQEITEMIKADAKKGIPVKLIKIECIQEAI